VGLLGAGYTAATVYARASLVVSTSVAELMRDPDWHAAWKAKQAASRRTLSDERIQEAASPKGTVRQVEVARHYGTTPRMARGIWRGQLAP
jgi:hypothetical protein